MAKSSKLKDIYTIGKARKIISVHFPDTKVVEHQRGNYVEFYIKGCTMADRNHESRFYLGAYYPADSILYVYPHD